MPIFGLRLMRSISLRSELVEAVASGLRSHTKSAPWLIANRKPTFIPFAKPTFSEFLMKEAFEEMRFASSNDPSVDALSMTTMRVFV